MAIIENLINVIVPLLICGLIFVYFRRRITNLEQSVDILMKMVQTNDLTRLNHKVENLYVPSSDNAENRQSNLDKTIVSDSELVSDSESESESDSESESESDSESDDTSQTRDVLLETTTENDNLSPEVPVLTEVPVLKEAVDTNVPDTNTESSGNTSKTVLLKESYTEQELKAKGIIHLRNIVKEKYPNINNLSRLNKASLVEKILE
jgi:hypothetical protein